MKRWFAVPLLGVLHAAGSLFADEDVPDEIVTLPEFIVSSQAIQDEYVASEAMGGTRTGAKIIDLPYTVQVLTEQFLQDFSLYEADQQLTFVSGYSPGATGAGDGPRGSRIRGFPPLVLVDGFSRVGVPETITTSQVEVIKGPQSTLYGRAQPGGLINYVSKRPRERPQYSAQLIGGSYSFRRLSIEATGPIRKDRIYYNVGYLHSYNEGDMEYFYLRQNVFGGGLTYKFNQNTSLTLRYERQERTMNRGTQTELRRFTLPVSLADPLRRTGGLVTGVYLPLAHFNQYGPNNRAKRDTEKWNALFEHRINHVWSFRINSQYYNFLFDEIRRTGVQFIEETQRFNESQPFAATVWEDGVAFQGDLLARIETGEIGHMLLFAVDWAREKRRREDYMLPGREEINAQPDSVRFVDPFNPEWQPIDRSQLTRLHRLFITDQDYYGAFASHRGFFMSGRLITFAGIRYDESSVTVDSPIVGEGTHDSLSYALGLNYNVLGTDDFVIFANRSTAFNPSTTIDQGTGEPQRNEESEGWEIGIKSLAFDEKLALTLSVYELTRLNIPTSNPDFISPVDTPGIPQFIGTGIERAEGLDFDMSFRPNTSWTMIGSFGYTDARIVDDADNPEIIGDVLLRIPRITGSLALRYVAREGYLQGLRVGLSGTYTGGLLFNRESATRLRYERGPVRLYNGFIGYNWRDSSRRTHAIQLNVLNILDEFYLEVGGRVGRGREFRLSYRIRM